ncbi:DUF4124 domain-containing protein, partial [Dokdonella sp.]|uniref:DUF4124 domain-containing protein n=1 Tax=Dokdonella sp. TaxID=2291710 RepID=UPI003C63A108
MRTALLAVLLIAVVVLFWLQRWHAADHVESEFTAGSPQLANPKTRTGTASETVERVAAPVNVSGTEPDDLQALAALATSVVHQANTAQACLAGTGRGRPAGDATIHRWVDAAGIIHFSDKPPSGEAQQHRQIKIEGLAPIRVDARGVDVNLPDYVVQRATMDTQAIERIFRSSLGMSGEPGLVLSIEYIASARTYAERIGSTALADSDGAYSGKDRTIRIRHRDDIETSFQILRHEIAHALVHEHVGQLPVAINEGLAGFFERIEVTGMGARIALDDVRRKPDPEISVDGQDELVDLLAREGAGFYGAGQEQRYFRAKALIALLMERAEGRTALGSVLSAQRLTPCQPVEPALMLEQTYPGGLEALARDWSGWLRHPSMRVA